jgi:hypothetical protein
MLAAVIAKRRGYGGQFLFLVFFFLFFFLLLFFVFFFLPKFKIFGPYLLLRGAHCEPLYSAGDTTSANLSNPPSIPSSIKVNTKNL